MAITHVTLARAVQETHSNYRVFLSSDIEVTYSRKVPRRIIIHRSGRRTSHYWMLQEEPSLEDGAGADALGQVVLEEVNRLLKNRMLPYSRPRKPRRKSGRPRDSQKTKLYRCEETVSAWGKGRMAELSDVRFYVQRIVQSAWWRHRYPNITYITVNKGRGRGGFAYTTKSLITLPEHAWHPMYIIHEMAHIAADHDGSYKTIAAHGPEYCRIYLDIVQHAMGQQVVDELRSCMDRDEVKYDPAQ